jgi:hypothetical protein
VCVCARACVCKRARVSVSKHSPARCDAQQACALQRYACDGCAVPVRPRSAARRGLLQEFMSTPARAELPYDRAKRHDPQLDAAAAGAARILEPSGVVLAACRA